MKKFEYDTIKVIKPSFVWKEDETYGEKFKRLLNEKGAEGWELVHFFDRAFGLGGLFVYAVLKREIETE